ncbi:YciE/YciF ferroxidase family protein [Aegicerativicinus sediminis]|uniref:YciE/YciF ferroxidase family protein n=1 Tax=Aegicerativicinus sediminis TaxID=2893202 RepID=UPI001E31955E|nr:ferritin-like domain-containing protein [Aegicerativicinus sediminis]
MKTLQELFEHEIKDLYSAEKQLVDTIPKMVEAANDNELKDAFSKHLTETKEQLDRLKNICENLDINPTSTKCKAMEGLINECEHFLREDSAKEVMDAGLIACAQKVEHYEISGYGTTIRYAKELGHNVIAEELQKSLDQEYKADKHMNDMAEDRLNRRAIA